MESAKNPLEQFVDTQNKIFEAWSQTSKQMMGSLYPENNSEKGKELFESWWNEQREIVQEIINPSNPEEAIKNAPSHMQKWMDSQMKFMEKLTEFYKSMGEQYNMGTSFEVPDMLKDNYSKWQEFMTGSTKMLADAMKAQTPAYNAAAQFQSWSKTYTEMFGQWDAITKMIQQGTSNMENFKMPFSADAYKKMTEQMMGMNPADSMKSSAEYVDQMFKQAIENYKAWNEGTAEMSNMLKSNMKQFPMMGFDAGFMNNISSMMQENMEKSFAPFAHFQNKGKSAEVMEIMKAVPKAYADFVMKGAEMQGHIYTASQEALPATIEHFAEQYEKEEKTPTFEEFFKAWTAKMEGSITKVLESKDYTALQNEVSKANLTVKQHMDRLAEMAFEGTPLTTRSEADDLASELAALRKKVRSLEKKLAESAEASKPATTKKTTSSRSKASSSAKK